MSPHASRGWGEAIANEEKQTRDRGGMCFVKGSRKGITQTFDMLISKVSLRCFCHSSVGIISFAFGIKFRETKQIVVALVATTFKALLSVTKTNSRLSGHKFYAGNIYYLSWNIIVHIYPLSLYKKSAPHEGTHRKNASLECCYTNSLRYGMRKERKHFLPKYFPVSEKKYAVCVA